MKRITTNEKEMALKVLSAAFSANPGVLYVAKKDINLLARIDVLLAYCLHIAMNKKGAFISSDNKGVVLIFDSHEKQSLLDGLRGYIKLGNDCIGWDRAPKIILRQRKILKMRYKPRHLYCWMIGVEDHKNGLTSIREMRDFIFDLSSRKKLPIVAETTMSENLSLYKRYGFSIYKTWERTQDNMTTWFIKREHNA